ncbi:MAG: ABC transporter permease, partial [Gammaproteobacteria bacterium]|nr:ABC transporter permease [Gammaproteobacteria bacterium]
MTEGPQIISLGNLLIAFLPALAVIFILFKWTRDGPEALYALARMLGQLLIIGYFLVFIFESESGWVVLGILFVMVLVSSWIALRTVKIQRRALLVIATLSILTGGGVTLLIISQLVLDLQPFYSAQYLIPLAGMVFASAMNSISICAERFQSERNRGEEITVAREFAFKAALIPITNALFAVGLVSLPGMMTGQIIAGVDPLIAARYQIMVMCMLFSSAGLS